MIDFRLRRDARLYRRGNAQQIDFLKALAVVAHSDDAEIVAAKGIIDWWEKREEFGVVVVNDGSVPESPDLGSTATQPASTAAY